MNCKSFGTSFLYWADFNHKYFLWTLSIILYVLFYNLFWFLNGNTCRTDQNKQQISWKNKVFVNSGFVKTWDELVIGCDYCRFTWTWNITGAKHHRRYWGPKCSNWSGPISSLVQLWFRSSPTNDKYSGRCFCSGKVQYLRNLQEQVKKAFCYQKLFWPFNVQTNFCKFLQIFAIFCKFSAFSLEFQKNFSITKTIFSHSRSEQFW